MKPKKLNSAPLYHELLEMSERPSLFIGQPSIKVLRYHLVGFRSATLALGKKNGEKPPFRIFQYWVHFQLNNSATHMGWAEILLEKNSNDEKAALTNFFVLFKQFVKLRIQSISYAKLKDSVKGKSCDIYILDWGQDFYSLHKVTRPFKHWLDMDVTGGTLESLKAQYPQKFKTLSPTEVKKVSKQILALHDQDVGF
jgi:hypothetical protein